MKIIDAHIHIFPPNDPNVDRLTQNSGHINSTEHLREVYESQGMVHSVVMGNHSLDPYYHDYPADMFHYCIGLDSSFMIGESTALPDFADSVEKNLQRDTCCGIKLYPGYNKLSLSDALYEPIYELAAQYDKPVAIHMGLTAHPRAHLKYCHPMALDEVAADHPDTNFVMCHFGNPFLETGAAVVEKNPNVSADLSGLLEGRVNLEQYLKDYAEYVTLLKAWTSSMNCWDKLMYGTDWPLVNMGEYIDFIKAVIPEKHWEEVFFENANRIYRLGL
ncbi:MAG: amidohydrolase [Oscillospiraceae bacterium]|nr:amidohydrolase [Oscillospiraceae bacterium]